MWPDEAKRGVGVEVPEGGLEADIIVVANRIDVRSLDRYEWVWCTVFVALEIQAGRLRTDSISVPARRQRPHVKVGVGKWESTHLEQRKNISGLLLSHLQHSNNGTQPRR